MTRINVGYPVEKLTRQHLIAEHRELPRIPNTVRKEKAKLENATDVFKLGSGHVTFFYKRLGYLRKRYIELYNECKIRGYNVSNYLSAWSGIPKHLMNDYSPTQADKDIIIERINLKLTKKTYE